LQHNQILFGKAAIWRLSAIRFRTGRNLARSAAFSVAGYSDGQATWPANHTLPIRSAGTVFVRKVLLYMPIGDNMQHAKRRRDGSATESPP